MDAERGEIPDEQWTLIKEALYRGQKIEAIKIYRDQTHLGLKESKEAIEKLEAELRSASPEKFTARTGGCGGLVLLAFVFAAIVLFLL